MMELQHRKLNPTFCRNRMGPDIRIVVNEKKSKPGRLESVTILPISGILSLTLEVKWLIPVM